jgi:hypothetical protein
VRRAWITLALAFAAVVGFGVGFVTAFLLGISATSDAECDGPCFSQWDEVALVAYGVGGLCAILCAFLAWRLIGTHRA